MSGLKTAAWTGVAVVATLMTGGSFGGIVAGAVAVFSAFKAWGSHKESQREAAVEAAHHAHAHFVQDDRQRERAMAIEQSYGVRDGAATNWAQEAAGRGAGVSQGRS